MGGVSGHNDRDSEWVNRPSAASIVNCLQTTYLLTYFPIYFLTYPSKWSLFGRRFFGKDQWF